jgi:protein-S-isoprenylcysteine O-methyltransferase Ste14
MNALTLRLAALAALVPVLIAYADTPWRTFGQRFVAHRWAERMVLFSIELNLLLMWVLVKLLMARDVGLAPDAMQVPFAAAGAVLAWAGCVLAVGSRWALGRWFSGTFAIRPEHALVTTGPYAITRHPMYTALLALLIGLAICWDSAVSLGFALMVALPFWLHTHIEEQLLEAHFGDEWRAYRARVPRLVPGWRGRRAGRWSGPG